MRDLTQAFPARQRVIQANFRARAGGFTRLIFPSGIDYLDKILLYYYSIQAILAFVLAEPT
jgi:hypothetical protein